jgi:hypothetical protein
MLQSRQLSPKSENLHRHVTGINIFIQIMPFVIILFKAFLPTTKNIAHALDEALLEILSLRRDNFRARTLLKNTILIWNSLRDDIVLVRIQGELLSFKYCFSE